VREACAQVASVAQHVQIARHAIPPYAGDLPSAAGASGHDPDAHVVDGSPEARAGYFLCLDAINFGSGWWPTIRKRPEMSGYFTLATSLRDRWFTSGAWTADDLAMIGAHEVAVVTGQEPDHSLMGLYAASLRDVGRRVRDEYRGRFLAVVERAGDSAVRLVETLAAWESFADVSAYRDCEVPFFKRAQLAAADLNLAGVAQFRDLNLLTAFADNVVPHVLRIDGVLCLDPDLERRIDSEQLLEHGSPEEVELRACAVHAVELIAREQCDRLCPQQIDHLLWNRGRGERYKAIPRPRARCTAY